MAKSMSLLWGAGSPPCWRLMIALEEKKLQGYKHKLLSFEKDEHKTEGALEINPRGQVGVAGINKRKFDLMKVSWKKRPTIFDKGDVLR